MLLKRFLPALLLGVFSVWSQGEKSSGPKRFERDYSNTKQMFAVIDTHEGTIEVELFFTEAPNTVANFAHLAETKFYDGLTFHRVIQGFMTQGGDPEGTGSGGPGYTIEDESNTLKHEAGVIAMASSGPNTSGSQFYLTHMPQPHLNGRNTVFGKIRKGFDVLARIEKGDVIRSIRIREIKK